MFQGKVCVFTTVLNLLPCYFSLPSQWQSTCMQAYGKYKDMNHQKTEMSAHQLWESRLGFTNDQCLVTHKATISPWLPHVVFCECTLYGNTKT